MSLRTHLAEGKFAITAEVGPLKGSDTTEIKEVAHALKGKVTACNVTDQQSSVLRLGSLATCHMIKDEGVEPVLQMTCRDRNRIALQSDLLSAYALGIENVLVITGDLPAKGDHPHAMAVYDLDSVQLLYTIKQLNEGKDLSGNELKGKPDLFAGAVVNPGAETEAAFELQLMKMEKKIAAGAKFFQTQGIFEARVFEKFMKRAAQFQVPIFAGIIPLKSVGMARYMNKSVPGIFVPEELIQRMSKAEDKVKMGLEIAASLIKELKPMCQGIHVMAIGWEKKVPTILQMAGLAS